MSTRQEKRGPKAMLFGENKPGENVLAVDEDKKKGVEGPHDLTPRKQ